MAFETKEAALEFATELALDGKYPDLQQVMDMREAGVTYAEVHNILSEVFYNGEELEDAESE